MGTLTIPVSFTNGTVANATEVNQDFAAVATWANGNVGANNLAAAQLLTATTHGYLTTTSNMHAAGSVVVTTAGTIFVSPDVSASLVQLSTALTAVSAAVVSVGTSVTATSGTIALGATSPVTVAHGQAVTPTLKAMFRMKDTATGDFTRWYQGNTAVFYGTNAGPSSTNYGFTTTLLTSADDTNIYFSMQVQYESSGNNDDWVCYMYDFSAGVAANYYLQNVTAGTWLNIWDEFEVKYWISSDGV